MSLRVDLNRISREDCQAALAAQGIAAQSLPWSPTALQLEQPMAVTALPGFAAGQLSVQDAGAQCACALLAVQPGERVLDACAAPGGKTGALLEAVDGALDLLAVDVDAGRIARITENLKRLRREARLACADLAADPAAWWDGVPFDRILLDAPCSASGVIRRHPDIKLLRRESDIGALAATQQRLLERLLGLLRPGGRLLYSTCSVLPQENEHVVKTVLGRVPRARVLPWPEAVAPPPGLRDCGLGAQLLPGNAAQADGFYYACLTVT